MAKAAMPDRLREPQARILALRIAALCPSRTALTSHIKEEVPNYVTLTPLDLRPSKTRKKERMWQQIVGNVVSHKGSGVSIFNSGYADRVGKGICVTDKGIAYLASLGF